MTTITIILSEDEVARLASAIRRDPYTRVERLLLSHEALRAACRTQDEETSAARRHARQVEAERDALRSRVVELESERAWRPIPDEWRDGRWIEITHFHDRDLFFTVFLEGTVWMDASGSEVASDTPHLLGRCIPRLPVDTGDDKIPTPEKGEPS